MKSTSTHSSTSAPRLKGEYTITLHTRFAQALFLGDWKRKRMGLLQFAEQLKQIYQSNSLNEAATQIQLAAINHELEAAERQLQTWRHHYEQLLQRHPNIQLGLVKNDEPTIFPLRLGTPEAFKGAYLIAAVDNLVRILLTLENVGLLLVTTRNTLYVSITDIVKKIFTDAYKI